MRHDLYLLYDLPVRSRLPLNAPRLKSGKAAVTIRPAAASYFKKICPEPFASVSGVRYQMLENGSVYIRFFDFFRFQVSKNGREILYQQLKPLSGPRPRFRSPLVFLQTNVFSFSLLKIGLEVFHASSVTIKGKAVAFLGESGYGKSTTAASFLKKGHPLLTDDLLAIEKKGGRFLVRPGVPQIKLWPQTARTMALGPRAADTMSPAANKLILPLSHRQSISKPCEAGVLYILWPRFKKGGNKIRIKRLKPQEGAISLIKASHNLILQDQARLKKQMSFASELAGSVPVRAVSFPRDFRKIPALRARLLKDIDRFL